MQEKIYDTIVLGGGLLGMATAYDLAQAGKKVLLLEKAPKLGGLAAGFRGSGWEWDLDYAYHHLFASDSDIIDFVKEIGHPPVFFRAPSTSSLYDDPHGGGYRSYPLDTPFDLLRFPLLSFADRIRTGLVFALFKISPFLRVPYETHTLQHLLTMLMGERAYKAMFGEMMRKKYGKYAGKILASFIWTRINKRSKNLGYIKGGFQHLTDYLEQKLRTGGVDIVVGASVTACQKKGPAFHIEYKTPTSSHESMATTIVSTLPSPVLSVVGQDVLTKEEITSLASLKYLWATTLIIETDVPILTDTYWLSLCTPNIPGLVCVQHTNYMDKKHYNGHHILYVGNYIDADDRLLKMTKEETLAYYLPHLRALAQTPFTVIDSFHFKAPYAQPIFDSSFLKHKPTFLTSSPGFFIANLDMTYPYDRGTNYAVKLGREVAQICHHYLDTVKI